MHSLRNVKLLSLETLLGTYVRRQATAGMELPGLLSPVIESVWTSRYVCLVGWVNGREASPS